MSLDPKQIAKAVLAGGKKPLNGSGDSEEDGDSELEVAAGNIISASKSGDNSALASSLKEFVSMCSSE